MRACGKRGAAALCLSRPLTPVPHIVLGPGTLSDAPLPPPDATPTLGHRGVLPAPVHRTLFFIFYYLEVRQGPLGLQE